MIENSSSGIIIQLNDFTNKAVKENDLTPLRDCLKK